MPGRHAWEAYTVHVLWRYLMRFSRPPLALAVLSMCSAVAAGQRARPSGPPPTTVSGGQAYVATRFLPELEIVPANAGVFATGDLDNDGDLDALMCEMPNPSTEPTGLQTWLNGGRGDLHLAHVLALERPISSSFHVARQVSLPDLTGDAVLAVAYHLTENFGSHNFPPGVVFRPGLGDGSFGAGLLLETAEGPPLDFLAGDCDGDGDADLLVHETHWFTDDRDTLAWWRLESGGFVRGASLDVDAETPLRMSAMDVDGDGITDAVAGTFAGYDSLQFFRTVGGDPTPFATVPVPAELHNINQRQRTGDIDGDGREDVLLDLEDVNANLFYMQPILRTATGFALQPLQSLPNDIFERPYSRASELADWDGDGDLDLVSPTFTWLENTGGTRFELAAQQLSSWNDNGNRTPLHVVDLDGDGHLDALAGRMLFEGDGAFPQRTSVPPYHERLSFDWTTVEDWEGDGDLDLTGPFQLQLNNGDGTFVKRATTVSVPGAFSVEVVGWGDFDGDGLRNVIVSSFVYRPPLQFDRMRLFTGTETGTYVLSATVPATVQIPSGSSSGDLDGDGDEDILATSAFWPNDGEGHFGSPVAAYAGTPLAVLDVDGDQDLDLLVSSAGRMKLLRNLGGLAFATLDLGSYVSGSRLALQDADEDGDLDFVVAAPATGVVTVREQSGGGFLAPLSLSVPGVNGPTGLVDVDGDGDLDLVSSRTTILNGLSFQLLTAWIRGTGLDHLEYTERREWVTRDVALAYGDFDGDGDVEVFGKQVTQDGEFVSTARHFRNLRFDGAGDGSLVQYGLASATSGAGGLHPVLGSGGPVRPGQLARLSVGRGRGQASGMLLMGTGRVDVLDGGIRRLVQAPRVVRSFVLGGTAGAPGEGAVVLPLAVRSALIGLTFTFQAVIVDPDASSGLSATNGLEIHFGGRSVP